jgi:SM-20-related protein
MELSAHEVEQLGSEGWFVRDGFIGADDVRAARAELEHIDFRAAGMTGGRLDESQRGDRIAWLGPKTAPPALAKLCAQLEDLRLAIARDAWLPTTHAEIQAAHYPGGGARYARHRDAPATNNRRRVTAIVYLNPEWTPADGGQLRLGTVDLEPIAGRLVVFLSERVEHEVLPAHAPRYAVTAWCYGP